MSLSIVAPVYNAAPHVLEMFERMYLDGVLRHAPADVEIILVDDCSPLRRETEECVKRLESRREVRYVRNPENLGYAKTCNVGMRLVTRPFFLLTNTDIRLLSNTIDSLAAVLSQTPDVGMVSPVTNNAEGFIAQQVNGFPGIESYCDADFDKIERFAAAVDAELTGFWEPPWLLDFCCLFRSELLSKVGLYDENFGIGYGEENDYCLRARASGYRLLVHRRAFVFHGGLGQEKPGSWHFGAQSMNTRRLKAFYYKIRNTFYLQRKYGQKFLQARMNEYLSMQNPDIRTYS